MIDHLTVYSSPCVYLCLFFIDFFQTPHSDSRNYQRREGGFPSGHGATGVTLWRESAQCSSPFLHQWKNHHHPVSSLTSGQWPLNLFSLLDRSYKYSVFAAGLTSCCLSTQFLDLLSSSFNSYQTIILELKSVSCFFKEEAKASFVNIQNRSFGFSVCGYSGSGFHHIVIFIISKK